MTDTFARGRQVGPGELAQIRASTKPEAGSFVDLPSANAIREALTAGSCPFCGETKYRNLAGHMNRSHGHSAAEVREIAGMLKGTPLCDPDMSRRQRERMRGQRLPDSAYSTPRKRRTYSAAGRAIALAALERGRVAAGGQEVLSHLGSAASAASASELNRSKRELVARLWTEGQNLSEISESVGVHSRTAHRYLRDMGIVAGDGRRWERTRAEKVSPSAAGPEAARARSVVLNARRLARFDELGRSWEALTQIAEEEGYTTKAVCASLRRAGAVVPDGRKVSSKRLGRVVRKKVRPECSAEECLRQTVCRGMCRMHYQRSRR